MFKFVAKARFLKIARYAFIISLFSFALPNFGQAPGMIVLQDPSTEGSVSTRHIKQVMDAIESAIEQSKYDLIDRRSKNLDTTVSNIEKQQTSGLIDYAGGEGWQELGKQGAGGAEEIMCETEIVLDSSKVYVKYTLKQGQRGRIIKTASKEFSANTSNLKKACEKLAKTLFK